MPTETPKCFTHKFRMAQTLRCQRRTSELRCHPGNCSHCLYCYVREAFAEGLHTQAAILGWDGSVVIEINSRVGVENFVL